jgi:hypothetical protein
MMLSRPSTANGRIFVPKNRPHHDYVHEFHVHAGASEYLLESQHGTLARSTHGYRYQRQSHVVFPIISGSDCVKEGLGREGIRPIFPVTSANVFNLTTPVAGGTPILAGFQAGTLDMVTFRRPRNRRYFRTITLRVLPENSKGSSFTTY